ncbi:MAG TPA: hypothetical protein VI688_01595 [Anaerolineales bacterium]|nr:hypothetical protein [Anaerolineales bacterium]
MKKLTVFTAPKPFVDPHIATIQRNAIQSWLRMGPDVEVLLIGDEAGMAETATQLGVSHLKGTRHNKEGTPLVSSIFQMAREAAQADLLLFANTDIIFFPETLALALKTRQQVNEFVLLGQRYDLDISHPIDFSGGWPERVRADVKARGRLHPLGGSDYFLFPRHLFSHIPDFAIGRAGWDNWMIYHAVTHPWPVINATPSLIAVHQNHDYSHLAEARNHQRHPETFANAELAGGMRKMYMLLDVGHELVDSEIRPARWNLARFLRSLERRLQPDELVGRGPRWLLLRQVRKLRRALAHSEAN